MHGRAGGRYPYTAGVVLTVAAVASWAVLVGHPGVSSGETSVAPSGRHRIVLLSIDMVTARVGWATSKHFVLHTTDGGHEWTTSWRGSDQGRQFGSALVTLGARHVWVPAFPHALLVSTANGDRTWRVSTPLRGSLAGGDPATFGQPGVTFIDSRHGWIVTSDGALTARPWSGQAQYTLYRTTDGGTHWSRLSYTTLYGSHRSHGGLPACDCLGGISFRNRQVGWVTGTPFNGDSRVILYRTTDGGTHWRTESLPPPKGVRRLFVSTAPPTFFAADGVLPVAFNRANVFVLYVSHDGGTTWRPTTPLRLRPGGADADAFALDLNHVWLWADQSLYYTSDGGKRWRALTHLPLYAVPELQFLSRTRGYLLNPHPPGNTGQPYLLKTSDGGRTWQKVTTYLSG